MRSSSKHTLRALLAISFASLAWATQGWAQNPQVMVSWGNQCPTIETNKDFTGPALYSLWIGLKNLTVADRNVAFDVSLFYGPTVPDAWRFEINGCQTPARAMMNELPNTKACPAMVGANPETITDFYYDSVTQRMQIRLASVYNAFNPSPGITYTLWNVIFDHTHSVSGADADPGTCDNAGLPLCLSIPDPSDPEFPPLLITTDNTVVYFHFANPSDQFVSWNSGCDPPVPSGQTTWGKIKESYR